MICEQSDFVANFKLFPSKFLSGKINFLLITKFSRELSFFVEKSCTGHAGA
jgi:hypothetical protein